MSATTQKDCRPVEGSGLDASSRIDEVHRFETAQPQRPAPVSTPHGCGPARPSSVFLSARDSQSTRGRGKWSIARSCFGLDVSTRIDGDLPAFSSRRPETSARNVRALSPDSSPCSLQRRMSDGSGVRAARFFTMRFFDV
jgi:hypothetical protein